MGARTRSRPVATLTNSNKAEAAHVEAIDTSSDDQIFSNLTRQDEWNRFERSGFVPITRCFFQYLLERVPEDDLKRAAVEFGPTWARENIVQHFGELTPENFVKWMRIYIKNLGLTAKVRTGERTVSVTVQNDLGAKCGAFIEALLDSTLRTSFDLVPEAKVTRNLITLQFQKQM